MISNFPAEILLITLKHLNLAEIGQLAWTDKRMMQIVKRNAPTALGRMGIYSISIHPVQFKFNEYTMKIKWNSEITCKYATSVQVFTFNFDDKVTLTKYDIVAFNLFRNYCISIKRHLRENPECGTLMTWETYADNHRHLWIKKGDEHTPIVPLCMIMPRIEARRLTIYNCKRLRLLNLMNIIDSYFGIFHEISIRCFEMQFSDTDKSIVENSRMLRKGVRFFEMVAPPFAIEMMKMTNKLNPEWQIYHFQSEQFSLLPYSGVLKLSVREGSLSIHEFITCLLLSNPIIETWKFYNVKNMDDLWGHHTIEELLSNSRLKWTMKNVSLHEIEFEIHSPAQVWLLQIRHLITKERFNLSILGF